MAKKVVKKLNCNSRRRGQSRSSGRPRARAAGVNIMGFCKEFNAKTKDQAGMILPVVISVYQDKSFTFILKSPPAAVLIKKAAKVETASAKPNV